MPRTIIVPLDGSLHAERALEPAWMLAQQAHAQLVLVTTGPEGMVHPMSYLEAAARNVGGAAVLKFVSPEHSAADAIMRIAASEPGAVVCMTTRTHGGVGLPVLGSVAEEVLRRIEVPLVLVGPSMTARAGSAPFKELLVCLDGSHAGASIMPTAVRCAGTLGLSVWLVGVVDPEWEAESEREAGHDVSVSGPLERVALELRASHIEVNWETLHGPDAAEAIVNFARNRSAPLIAMTTHGRTGLARVLAGSVAMAVVRDAPCPVLVTRSPDLGD